MWSARSYGKGRENEVVSLDKLKWNALADINLFVNEYYTQPYTPILNIKVCKLFRKISGSNPISLFGLIYIG